MRSSRVLARGGAMAVLVAAASVALGEAPATGRDGTAPEPSPVAAQARAGKLTVLSVSDVDSIDPGITYSVFGETVANATQRTVLGPPGGAPGVVPDLASAPPEVSPDGMTVTVRIKGGVRFSPPVNREVTSGDVRYALERGFFWTVANPYAAQYFGDLVGARHLAAPGTTIPGLRTPDDRTLVLRLARPRGRLVAAALAMMLTAPVPREYAAAFDRRAPTTYGRHQVATGPYMIENDAHGNTVGYRPGRRIHLVRNPNWDPATDYRPARLAEIDIRAGHTDTERASRLILRGRSMITGDFAPPLSVLRRGLRRHRDQFSFAIGGLVAFAPLNTRLAPFTDVNVRRAVVAGFDRGGFLREVGGRLAGVLATHFIPPGVTGFEEAGGFAGTGSALYAKPGGDRRLAATYLRRAGFRSGRYEGRRALRIVVSNDAVGRRLGRFFRRNLVRLGFRVRLRAARPVRLLLLCGRPSARIHSCPQFGWLADFPDAETVIDPLFSGAAISPQGNFNRAQLNVPAINRAIRSARALVDPQARAQAWAAIDRQLVDLAPGVLLAYPQTAAIRSRDVVEELSRPYVGTWDLNFTALR